ncbi:coiled-coil domain-containing protein 78 [Lepisosteus oculatus]|uniref:coiled-coil domain-containing protein 78 n=1 Tax=Lepisosteus oculatus TaxID=7918 RepID=UPI0035F50DE5
MQTSPFFPQLIKMNSPEDSGNVSELREHIARLTNENIQLRDKNERLFSKLGDLQDKLGHLAGSKTDLSSKLVFSEEEKLKISKDLIEMQIQTNNMREQYEAEGFELKNKILTLENQLVELEMERDRLGRENQAMRGRLQTAERNHKELADEYITLKSNYLALSKEHEKEVSRNEELSAELLGLARAQDDLLKQQESQARTRALYGEATQELERVRAVVSRLSQRRVRPEHLASLEQERRTLEKSLLGHQDQIREELEKMKTSYEEQQSKLEEKVVAMGKEQQENKRAIRNTQHKLAEQSAALLTSQSQLKEVEAENSRLQLQLKELNEEYRARLVRYLQDLAEYVDASAGAAGTKRAPERAQMKNFVDNMLQDVRASYRSREEQLASAARSYKKRLQQLIRTHETLLIAYRMRREQILALGDRSLDPGPPESHFSLPERELQGEQSLELARLREDKARLESQLRDAQEQKSILEIHPPSVTLKESGTGGKASEEAWADIRKQLREFTHSTQEEQERERAQLITRATVAEEQVSELQEYVDKHLARYKQEITRLRKLLGTDTGRAHSADAPEAHLLRHAKRNPSYEL